MKSDGGGEGLNKRESGRELQEGGEGENKGGRKSAIKKGRG